MSKNTTNTTAFEFDIVVSLKMFFINIILSNNITKVYKTRDSMFGKRLEKKQFGNSALEKYN